MRSRALLALLASLAMFSSHASAAPPQPPPDDVRVSPQEDGVLVDWSRSTVPVPPWVVAYEVLRREILPAAQQDYRVVGAVPPHAKSFVDAKADEPVAYAYCVRAVTVDGPQACSEDAFWIDLADCVLLYGSYVLQLDTHCLYTTDPPLPIPYPTCAPVGAMVSTQPSASVTPRMGCLWIEP